MTWRRTPPPPRPELCVFRAPFRFHFGFLLRAWPNATDDAERAIARRMGAA